MSATFNQERHEIFFCYSYRLPYFMFVDYRQSYLARDFMRRSKTVPKLKMGFWTQKALFYYADANGLTAAILNSRRTAEELQAKMGHGYETIAQLLEGQGVGIYSASFVESALVPDDEKPTAYFYSHLPASTSHSTSKKLKVNVELGHFFTNLKCDVGRMLREMSAHDRRDGEGFQLHTAFTCFEDIQKESIKSLADRDRQKVRECWKRLKEINEKFDLFSRYKGNKDMKNQLIEFLNELR